MSQPYWFNRMVEYWTMPTDIETVVEHVRRARIQVVLSGNFGPDFYSLADDDTVARSWPGMVLNGVSENLAHAAELIPRLKEAGARVVGQLSMTMHFGDCDRRKGLFGEVWERMWTDDLLGPAPCASAAEVLPQPAGPARITPRWSGMPRAHAEPHARSCATACGLPLTSARVRGRYFSLQGRLLIGPIA